MTRDGLVQGGNRPSGSHREPLVIRIGRAGTRAPDRGAGSRALMGSCLSVCASIILVLLAWGASTTPASAELRLCNKTGAQVGVALGYRDPSSGWVSEGWWNLPANGCEVVLTGPLSARYYYLYAVDYQAGGEWGGSAYMCTREKEFTIHGIEDCFARGFERTGFVEIDTGEQQSWTVQLTEQTQTQTRTGGR